MASDALSRLSSAAARVQDRLLTPALVFDVDAVRHNVRAMLARVEAPDRWRPHVKTIKCSALVRILLEEGVRHFKCATVPEMRVVLTTAEALDLTASVDVSLAYPVQRAMFQSACQVFRGHPRATVHLLADDPEHLRNLDRWAADVPAHPSMSVMLDIDLGMRRTGCAIAKWKQDLAAIEGLQHLKLSGLHGYDGHWRWNDREPAHAGYDALCELADHVGRFAPVAWLVTSGTHSYAHALSHARLQGGPWTAQVSPGTIVLSDLRSHEAARDLGLLQGVYVASRVVSTPGSRRATLDAGSKAIAPDVAAPNCAVLGHDALSPSTPSEEHLPLDVIGDEHLSHGSLLWLVPAHACTTVNLHRRALVLAGDRFLGECDIEAQGHSLWANEVAPALRADRGIDD